MRGAEAAEGAAVDSSTVPADSQVTPPPTSIMSNSRLLQRIRDPPQPPSPILACLKIGLCIIPIAQIAMGARHLQDCPQGPYIPIYLIVSGVFSLALAALSCLPCARQATDEPTNLLSWVCATWNSLTSFFLFCWFVAGNVWIYSIYEPNYNKNTTSTDPYCDRTLYLFAFWTTTLVYILLALFLVGACCILVCFYLLGRADPDDV